MSKTNKLLHTLIATGLALAGLFAHGFSPQARAEIKDELIIGITQFPSTFNPNIDSMMAKSYILAMTRRPFTSYDENWQLICMLCTVLPTMENGLAKPEVTPDGKNGVAVTYTIQPKATWGDGIAVSTRDVLFTWRVGRHEKSGVGNSEFYRSLYKIDIDGDKVFTLHFDKLTFDFNAINDFLLLPAHLDEPAFANPEAYRSRTTFDTDTSNKGLYFGPYKIVAVAPGSHVVLEPNPTWWGKKPFYKRIIIRVVENTAALEANLVSGALDMIAGELGLTIDQAISFERRNRDDYNVIYKSGLIYEHIDLNLDNPILGDIRIRRALIQAIDREAISKQLFEGRQPIAHASVSPLDWVYDKDVIRYEYDPEKAEALLDEAGWTVFKSGLRFNSYGEPLRLEIMTTAGNRTREMVQQVLQSQWREIGIDVRIKNEPARVFFGQTVSQRKFKAMAMFAWISAPESVPRTTLHSDSIPTPENNYSGQNYTGFSDPDMDTLLETIETELDRTKRLVLWKRLQDIYARELPVIPLYFRANAYILPKNMTGLIPTGHQYPSSLWVENWRPID